MIRLLLAIVLAWPLAASPQPINSALTGNWKGGGTVHLKPTSRAQNTSCNAVFDQQSGFWLRGAVTCKKGRRTDRIELRFSEPARNGDLEMKILSKSGKTLVTFQGSVSGSEIMLFHPEVLTFSGEAYRPVLRLDATDGNLRMSQIGVPTRSNNAQYLMSDIIFKRSGK